MRQGGSQEITATLTPDSDAITGDYVATLTVSNDEATSSAEFRVSVKTKTTWGIIAIAIILLLILCLGMVFRKYGRR